MLHDAHEKHKGLIVRIREARIICWAKLQLWFNLTVPLRLAYARDRARYAAACDEEACRHYGEKRGLGSQAWLQLKAFGIALTPSEIPQWFVDSWFVSTDDVAVRRKYLPKT